MYLCPDYKLLRSPLRTPHPLWKRLTLVASTLSGKRFQENTWHQSLSTSFSLHCQTVLLSNIAASSAPAIKYTDTLTAINFLPRQLETIASYPTLNTFRSGLSLILGKRFSNDKRVSRFLRGIFKIKPCFPKYLTTWDSNLELESLYNLYPNEELFLGTLAKKLVSLLVLSTGQRVQTLSMIRLASTKISNTNIE